MDPGRTPFNVTTTRPSGCFRDLIRSRIVLLHGGRGRHALNSIGVTFEWDGRKAAANRKKHRVVFEDAATVFLDPLAITYPDPDHSSEEQREITIGCTIEKHVVFVSHCERGTLSDH